MFSLVFIEGRTREEGEVVLVTSSPEASFGDNIIHKLHVNVRAFPYKFLKGHPNTVREDLIDLLNYSAL